MIELICPICGEKLNKTGGEDGNPFNAHRKEKYVCSSCGYSKTIDGNEDKIETDALKLIKKVALDKVPPKKLYAKLCPICFGAFNPTLNEDGNTAVYVCDKCGFTVNEAESYETLIIKVEASCEGEGRRLVEFGELECANKSRVAFGNAKYPLCNVSFVVDFPKIHFFKNHNGLTPERKAETYEFEYGREITILDSKGIATYDGHPSTEKDTYKIIITKKEIK